MDRSEKILNKTEVAERLGISIRTVERRVADGELECLRLGEGPKAPVRFRLEHVAAYVYRCEIRRPSTRETIRSILR